MLTTALAAAVQHHQWETGRQIALHLPAAPAPDAPWELCAELAAQAPPLAGCRAQDNLAARALAMMPRDAVALHGATLLHSFVHAEALAWAQQQGTACAGRWCCGGCTH